MYKMFPVAFSLLSLLLCVGAIHDAHVTLLFCLSHPLCFLCSSGFVIFLDEFIFSSVGTLTCTDYQGVPWGRGGLACARQASLGLERGAALQGAWTLCVCTRAQPLPVSSIFESSVPQGISQYCHPRKGGDREKGPLPACLPLCHVSWRALICPYVPFPSPPFLGAGLM